MRSAQRDILPLIIIALCALSFGRVFSLESFFFDDSAWLMSSYTSQDLGGFLDTGFLQLRRSLMGGFFYYYLGLHQATDHAYLIWSFALMTVQVLSSLFLYSLVNNLSEGKRLLSLLVAGSFIALPLDTTFPVHVHINYRSGVMLGIISFYLTERALQKKARRGLLPAALALSALSYYVMIEGTVAYEPARLLLIAYMLSKSTPGLRALAGRALRLWSPFIMLTVPLVIYKLLYAPYGSYEGFYATSLLNFLDFMWYADLMRSLLFFNWIALLFFTGDAGVWPYLLGLLTFSLGVIILRRRMFPDMQGPEGLAAGTPLRDMLGESWKSNRVPLALGATLLVLPALMYIYAGKAPSTGAESRHGIILTFGYAILIGSVAYIPCSTFKHRRWVVPAFMPLVALFLGLGVFFHNVNLDLYRTVAENERRFWRAFTERFQALPEKAAFIMDVQSPAPYYKRMALFYYYQFEFPLNLLYATSEDPGEFRRHIAYPMHIMKEKRFESRRAVFNVRPLWGKDTFDTDKAVIIRYEGAELLVNQEILKKYPKVRYWRWLDKGFPKLPETVPEYPLRHKLGGLR
jgi:hypothetical protein